jgi:hypothetical protein
MGREGASSNTPEDDDTPAPLVTVELSDQKSSGRRGRAPGQLATQQSPQVRQRNEPKTWLAYLSMLTEDWHRTLRFLAILTTAGACVAGIMYVGQLNGGPWLELIVSVAAIITIGIRQRGGREGIARGPISRKRQQVR